MIELPNECFIQIFNNFQHDYESLYSCLLVNCHWCRIIVPILWSKIVHKFNNKNLINTCLLALNVEEQTSLIPFKILLPNYQKPLFEYTSYVTSVNGFLSDGVINWLNYNGYKEALFKWETNRDNLVKAVNRSLITMFLRTSKRLENLEVGFIVDNKFIKNLCKNDAISYLYLYQNWIASEEIAEILKNTTLTSLRLHDAIRLALMEKMR
ncbi:f-box domain-containing protein [Gigaspora margarita]|uniref:F-box domain-containing protein n=1 Tax=Gigaspora margarita TaxID=4874 RepID=A0A8H4B1F8_GIGMA|nr:f-box domain-containing protein [Gigaspora margarita]